MKRFGRIWIPLLLACALVLAALPVAAQSTERVESLVVLGDSISTGYGLNGSLYERSSYANLVAQALGLSAEKGYVNYAVDGYTSAQILQMAKDHEDTVAAADMIMMTNGGNDVLWKMLNIALGAVGVTELNIQQLIVALMFANSATVEAKLYSEQNVNIIATALVAYRTNLTSTMNYLRRINPDARVLVLTQYNPTSGMSAFSVLDNYAEGVIGQLNDVMKEVVTAAGYEIVDTHAVMEGNGVTMSNIMSGDIHPNALGHAKMAEMVKNYLGIDATEPDPDETTTVPVETTTVPDETTPVPTETTAPPPETTRIPEETTTEPLETTVEPSETTTEPLVTTTEPPIETTAEPIVTTTEPPIETTAEPLVTTTEPPIVTTAEPIVTTPAPVVTTTAEPATEPVVTEPDVSESESVAPSTTSTADTAPKSEQPTETPRDEKGAPTAVIVGAALVGVGVIALVVALCLRKRL